MMPSSDNPPSGPAPPVDRRLPHRVRLPPVPVGYGRKLREIEDWCRRRCGARGDAWDAVGTSFYFAERDLAAEFARLFAAKPPGRGKTGA